jgi:hypothetical protein
MKILGFVGVLMLAATSYAGSREVPGSAAGRYYNEVWERWSEMPIHVWVESPGRTSKGETTFIKGGNGAKWNYRLSA